MGSDADSRYTELGLKLIRAPSWCCRELLDEGSHIWCQKCYECGSSGRVKGNTGSDFPIHLLPYTLNLKGF